MTTLAVTTLAVARYLGADVLRSQRWLLPLLVHAAVVGVLFGGDPGPPPVPREIPPARPPRS